MKESINIVENLTVRFLGLLLRDLKNGFPYLRRPAERPLYSVSKPSFLRFLSFKALLII